ncbi:MAG: winged helix-turn-helix domain-containing protein, partial [Lachnospiraceae bacterium]|nr:winged helix-turn-helix domain-containing protein [Lachnospiraceae bacterium]
SGKEKVSGKISGKEKVSGKISGKEKVSGKNISGTSEKILHLILEQPDITLPELSRQTGRTERAVSYNLRKLQDEGRLTRVGGRKLGYWQVNHDNG